jgi:hypothetical protein
MFEECFRIMFILPVNFFCSDADGNSHIYCTERLIVLTVWSIIVLGSCISKTHTGTNTVIDKSLIPGMTNRCLTRVSTVGSSEHRSL